MKQTIPAGRLRKKNLDRFRNSACILCMWENKGFLSFNFSHSFNHGAIKNTLIQMGQAAGSSVKGALRWK
jgi:hypothetical protein